MAFLKTRTTKIKLFLWRLKMKLIALPALALGLACAPPSLNPEQNMKFVSMKMYTDKNDLKGRNYISLGTVKGRAYMRGSLFEKGHMDMNEAYDLMKRNAVLMGADAIILESVVDIGMTATSFKTTECTATAIKFKNS